MAGSTDWTQLSAKVYLPRKIQHDDASATFSGAIYAISSPGHKIAWIFSAPETGSIRGVEFRTATVTTGGDLDITIESVDSTGAPTGDPLTTDASVTVTIDAADDNTWIVPSDFSVDVPITQGDLVAIVATIPTGSTANLQIASANTIAKDSQLLPRLQRYRTDWESSAFEGPVFAVKYDDDAYRCIPNAMPYTAFQTTLYSAASTPDEKGLKFQAPFNCRVIGWWIWMYPLGDFRIRLYASDDTVLGEMDIDRNWHYATAGRSHNERLFDTPINLDSGSWYRLTLIPTASSVTLYEGDTNSQAIFNAIEQGADWHHTERTNEGAWTDTTTRRPFMGLIIDQLDASDEPITTTSASTSQSSTASTSATTSATGTSNTTSASTSATTVATTTASTSMSSTASTSMSSTASTSATTSGTSSFSTTVITSASTTASTSASSTATTSMTSTASSSATTSASTTATTSYSSTASTSATSTASTSATTAASTTASTSASTTATGTSNTTSASTSAITTASTSASSSASYSVSSSNTTTASTSATTSFTVTSPPIPDFTETVETSIPMLLLNRAGDSQRNPIITDIPFQYKFNKHDSTETLTALVVRVNGTIITDLTSRCVVSNFLITCDVTAGVDLQSGYPAVLNVFHITTVVNGVAYQAKHGIWVSNEIETMIALDGFIAESSGEPVVFRPQS